MNNESVYFSSYVTRTIYSCIYFLNSFFTPSNIFRKLGTSYSDISILSNVEISFAAIIGCMVEMVTLAGSRNSVFQYLVLPRPKNK